jgi:magnesium transporter
VLKTARLEGDEIRYAEVGAFVSRNHIITVRHGDNADYALARKKFQNGPKSTQLGPDFILHAIIGFIVDPDCPAHASAMMMW